MPVSVVCGGQFGSEGKGKVAHDRARRCDSPIVVRVGGSNSGHTVIDSEGNARRFRVLPTAAILPSSISVIAAGSYLDASVLIAEISKTGLDPSRLLIDPNAVLITDEHKRTESQWDLRERIGSTLSGTGAAVVSRLLRNGSAHFASSDDRLAPYVRDTRSYMREALSQNRRVIVEGTQGFGLSVLHSQYYPNVTARDTSAAGFVSEAGLSPLDVDEIILVIRAFPIRVAGNSGPLPDEINWETVTRESGYQSNVVEYSTVTKQVRRVARFDASIVRAAIEANVPTHIAINHLDYIDATCRKSHCVSAKVESFVENVEQEIGAKIDFLGFGPASVVSKTHDKDMSMSGTLIA